jgi:hypothetical protein
MSWTESQIRLFRAAAHNPEIARSHGLSMGKARTMSMEGVKHARGGRIGAPDVKSLLKQANNQLATQREQALQDDLTRQLQGLLERQGSGGSALPGVPGMAEGGEVSLSDILMGVGAIPAAMLARRPVNALARPLQRAFSRPVMGVESVAKQAMSPTQADSRFQDALRQAHSPYSKLPVWHGQGAYVNNRGLAEFNPLYAQELPRTMGRLDKDEEALKYAGQMGSKLDQWGVPIQRAVPNLFNIPGGADSLLMDKIGPEEIKRLAQHLGSDTVASHRPGNNALVFSRGDSPVDIRDLASRAAFLAPQSKVRYAVSRPGQDRVLVGKEPWMTKTYEELGLQ